MLFLTVDHTGWVFPTFNEFVFVYFNEDFYVKLPCHLANNNVESMGTIIIGLCPSPVNYSLS